MASAVEKAREMDEDQARELVGIMTSKMALRRAFELAGVNRKTLERIQSKVGEYEQEITAQEEEQHERKIAIDKNREEAMAMLSQMGLRPEDLVPKPRKKRSTSRSTQDETETSDED